ncbi:MAG: DUF930 domain-containing protein [Rhizobiales bacterium]|nr:DUF930 domain-containing protein [Hyphomicrobiales bacterium]
MRVLGLAIGLGAIAVTQAMGADERFAKSLQMLAPPERLEQLCGYTAMARIRKEDKNFRPDRTVANAMTEPRVQNDTIEVKGGAFRSRGKWFTLSYSCTATPDRLDVVAFSYTIGPEIPQTQWASYGLWQ